MEKDAMFGEVEYYQEPSYFKKHAHGKLYYGGKWHEVEFFAFLHADAYDRFKNYINTSCRKKQILFVSGLCSRMQVILKNFPSRKVKDL